MRLSCIIVGTLLLVLTSTLSAQTDAQVKGQQELEQYVEDWASFMKEGDIELLRDLYPEDHTSMSINNGIIRERNYPMLYGSLKAQFASRKYTEFDYTEGPHIHVSRDGTMGWILRSVRITYEPRDGSAAVTFKGTGIDVMEKREGKWVEGTTSWKFIYLREPVEIDVSVLNDYAGAYYFAEQNITFHAEVENGTLQIRSPVNTVKCTADTEFTFKLEDESMDVMFVRDTKGKVSHMIVMMELANVVLPRVED